MSFKKYLPLEDYTLTSRLSTEEIKKRIFENTEPYKWLRFPLFSNNTKPYEGNISDDNFVMKRIGHRRYVLPVITGLMSNYLGQAHIHIKMRPKIILIIFLSLWLGITGMSFLSLLYGQLFHTGKVVQNNFPGDILSTLVIFLLGWFYVYFSFKYESKRSKQFLSSLLEGQETAY